MIQKTPKADMEDSSDSAERRRASDHRRFFRFDPTVSTGTLMQIVSILLGFGVAYGTYREDRATMKAEIEAVKVQAISDRSRANEMGADVKEIKDKLGSIELSLAVLKAQGAVQQQQQIRQR